jgi:PBP1b-binding outer membrane lipoprotein LpoB
MKRLILVMILGVFLAGCSGIIVNKFDEKGKLKERVITTASMVKMDFKKLSVQTGDVNVVIEKYVQDYNSQAWIDIGRGVAAGETGGASEVVIKKVE